MDGYRVLVNLGRASIIIEILQSICNGADPVLACCLASICDEHADLAIVVEAWAGLPGPVKAGILAMVEAAGKG